MISKFESKNDQKKDESGKGTRKRMGKKEDRQRQIFDLLLDHEALSVNELARQAGVTGETIRSDLDALEKEGLIVRGHGFARANRNLIELPFEQHCASNVEEKRVVAWRAIEEIRDGMVVYLDTGTTMHAGLELLRSKKDLTIVTNSLNVAETGLEMDFQVLLVGGLIGKQGRRCHGYFAEQMLRQIRFDLAILGTDGLKDLSGIGVGKPEEMGWERSVLDSANRTIVIADKSKFEVANVFLVGSLKEADLLITNFIEDELRQKISAEIELIETDGQKERRTLKTQIPCSKAEI